MTPKILSNGGPKAGLGSLLPAIDRLLCSSSPTDRRAAMEFGRRRRSDSLDEIAKIVVHVFTAA